MFVKHNSICLCCHLFVHSLLYVLNVPLLSPVDIQRVQRVSPGQHTSQFGNMSQKLKSRKDSSFSIFYSTPDGGEQSLNIVCDSTSDFDYLFNVINEVVKAAASERACWTADMMYLKDMWDRGDTDHSGTLSESEVINLVASMNINMPNQAVRKVFKKFDEDGSGSLNFREFTEFIEVLRER